MAARRDWPDDELHLLYQTAELQRWRVCFPSRPHPPLVYTGARRPVRPQQQPWHVYLSVEKCMQVWVLVPTLILKRAATQPLAGAPERSCTRAIHGLAGACTSIGQTYIEQCFSLSSTQ